MFSNMLRFFCAMLPITLSSSGGTDLKKKKLKRQGGGGRKVGPSRQVEVHLNKQYQNSLAVSENVVSADMVTNCKAYCK